MKAAWLMGALLIGAGIFVGLDAVRSLLRRAPFMTTADPSALGLVAFDSAKPVTLSMRATREQAKDGKYNVVDHRIGFTLPAAYVTLIDLKDQPQNGLSGSQRLGFQLWSRTLDPVTPDASAEYRLCKSKTPCPNGPYTRRIAAGESVIRIEITSLISDEARRQELLAYKSGLDFQDRYPTGRRCVVGYDKDRDLITLDAPPDEQPGNSCNFMTNGSTYRGTVRVVPRHFAKRNPDGTLRYAVRCNGFSKDDLAGTKCEIKAYFGIWPLFIWVKPSQIDEWDDIYRRTTEFLIRHIANRTDPVISIGDVK